MENPTLKGSELSVTVLAPKSDFEIYNIVSTGKTEPTINSDSQELII